MEKRYHVYIITNFTNSVLYTGITSNLIGRIYQHKRGIIKKSFSKRYRLYKLIWYEEFSNVNDAIQAEKTIKGWRRSRKDEMIEKRNSRFRDLGKELL